jgi:endoglycosylceramidase
MGMISFMRPTLSWNRRGALAIAVGALAAAGLAAPAAAASSSLSPHGTPGVAGPGVTVPAVTGPDVAPALPDAPIGHAGRWITDATGRVVLVSGVNMVYKLAPYAPDATGFGADDAAFLAANGFNAVRLGVIWKAVEPQPGVFDDSYLARIAATVSTLGSHGVLSLLDFHQDQYNEEFQGEGAPDWAVNDDGLPAFPQTGFPGDYFSELALQRVYDHFWANDPGPGGVGIQDRYAPAWQHVAAYFRGNAAVLGYDLFNEPFPGTSILTCIVPLVGCPVADATLTSFNKRVTAAIRQADPSMMVFSEPWVTFDFGTPTSIGATGDPHAGMSFHDYCPFPIIAVQLNVACPPFNDGTLNNAESHSSQTGDALLLTEFGAIADPGVLGSVVTAAARHKVGWTMWAYCGCGDPTGAPTKEGLVTDPAQPPTGTNVNQAMLGALAVPHPEFVAGTPASYGYDTSTRTFSLVYSTSRADGTGAFPAGSPTSAAVPAVQYPGGYRVVVSGAHVVSATSTLDLVSCPGATQVTVTVQPGSGIQDGCA